jgi:hypothetical protein
LPEVDGECHRARKGLFCCLQELLPERFPFPLVILALQYADNLLGKRGEVFVEEALVFQDFVAAGVSQEIRKLQA